MNGLWSDQPWWVKTIALVGVPSLVALGVIWSDRVQLLSRVEANARMLQELTSQQNVHAIRDEQNDIAVRDATRETNRILLAGCVNAAQTMEQRERCVGR